MDLKNKSVTIVGLARSGISLAKMVEHLGGRVRISERAPFNPAQHSFDGWLERRNFETEFGGHTPEFIKKSDLLVLSPGVSRTADPVVWAREENLPVIGEVELAWRFCPCPVIAVTGSNGKTTTTTLIKEILAASGRKAVACGNIGVPFSQCVMGLSKDHVVVLEISSFQLESIEKFRPCVAVLLNFSQNHLDRHADLDEYFEAKTRIFENQTPEDFAVLNEQDGRLKSLASSLGARVSFFNTAEQRRQFPRYNPNFFAAMEVARVLGIGPEICERVFAEFRGVEHRLEWIRNIDGVDYINDSKATTAEAGLWAIENFSRPIVMICGGRDKHIDFTVLRTQVRQKVKKMIVFGESREKIKRAFADLIVIQQADDLPEAVTMAKDSAVKGDVVLFSPMCTSFDMFANFEERGRVFKSIVREL